MSLEKTADGADARALPDCSGFYRVQRHEDEMPTGLMRPPLSAGVDSELKSAFLSAATGKGKAASASKFL